MTTMARVKVPLADITIEQVQKHSTRKDAWIIIDREVYDVSDWGDRHPGGRSLLGQWAGQDATAPFAAFHRAGPARRRATVLLGSMRVGKIAESYKPPQLERDFEALRRDAEAEGLFEPSGLFFGLHVMHIIVLDLVGFWMYRTYGESVAGFLAAAAVLTISQNQAGWLQHDLGHLSVFKSTAISHCAHHFVIGFMKVASASWWNFRHFQHHSKPNIIRKDPDVNMNYVFLLGDTLPARWAKSKRGFMPYQLQHKYWFLVGPPFLVPVYFHVDVLKHVLLRRKWIDMLMIAAAATRWMWLSQAGPLGTLVLYMFVRFCESHWFTWVTQMNHLPMKIGYEEQSWVASQLVATCNVDQSAFNDWFCGHLNFQIEHHLFPTMPRHSYHLITSRVEKLCTKHGLSYQSKTLLGAFGDIVESLRASGELWYEAMHLD